MNQEIKKGKKKKEEHGVGGVSSVFSFFPEGCISNIIGFTSPEDACRAATISWDFKSASESDTVWERFLPSDYHEIISKCVGPPLNYATKKDLFFNLCHSPILINDEKLSFWLSRRSGKKCYMLCARELSIAWKDTPIYWSWRSIPESRFSEVAQLKSVCWLDIEGKMQTRMLSLKTTYAAYLVFRVTEDSYGLDGVAKASVGFAEDISSFSTSTSTSESTSIDLIEPVSKSVYLVHEARRQRRRRRPVQLIDPPRFPQHRMDGWMEIFLGEFFNDEGTEGDMIKMKLFETKTLNWKRGLIVQGIELRPKEDA